ncbi:hypothetical protein NITMOv2_1814 [Nitrospira moscoviensis]|uniref:HTH luxR-type domain-containing protein n=2 Tax=Nitrospira moscoviensis TaxID=42253 RepID=A0A0K2GBI5_NITMO|nr:hypothetical protein NITMOv2_1814 [Nitrospira moscoviensis]
MARLSSRELRRLLDFIRDSYALRPHSEFPDYLVTSVGRIVPGDIHAYNEICTERKQAIAKWAPSSVQMIPDGFSILARHAEENPVVPYFERTGDGRPKKVTDFIPLGQFQHCALHNEFYLPFRIRYHLSTALTSRRKTLITLTSHRWKRDFSESERTTLDLIRPHVVQAIENARIYSSARKEAASRQAALETVQQPIMAVTVSGQIRWQTEAARTLCREYGLLHPTRIEFLSDSMREWLRPRQVSAESSIAAARLPLDVHGLGGSVFARKLSEGGEILLSLEKQSRGVEINAIRALGLNKRRTEVLGWVARGKSNPEIADILNISVRTVHKHVERIYQDLGVDHRHAAMAKVFTLS